MCLASLGVAVSRTTRLPRDTGGSRGHRKGQIPFGENPFCPKNGPSGLFKSRTFL